MKKRYQIVIILLVLALYTTACTKKTADNSWMVETTSTVSATLQTPPQTTETGIESMDIHISSGTTETTGVKAPESNPITTKPQPPSTAETTTTPTSEQAPQITETVPPSTVPQNTVIEVGDGEEKVNVIISIETDDDLVDDVIENNESPNPPQPTEGSKPTDPPQPTEGSKPTDPPHPTEGSKPTDPPQPTEGSKPTNSPQPTESSKPTDPPQPTEGTKPTDPPVVEELKWETFYALSSEEKDKYVDSFESYADFFTWMKKAQQQFKEEHPDMEIGPDGTIDLSKLK